jgi:hypothetical protein
MREGLCGTAETHTGADVVATSYTVTAFLARDANFKSDLITGFESCHTGTNYLHHPRRLVTQRHRLTDEDVAIAEVIVVMLV